MARNMAGRKVQSITETVDVKSFAMLYLVQEVVKGDVEMIILPHATWLDTLKVGDIVAVRSTEQVGGEIRTVNKKIKSISKTGIIKLEMCSHSFKDGYRRGFQYSGNCWLQPKEVETD